MGNPARTKTMLRTLVCVALVAVAVSIPTSTEVVDVEDVALPVKSKPFMDYVMSLIQEWDDPKEEGAEVEADAKVDVSDDGKEVDAEATLVAADPEPQDNEAAKLSIVKTASKVKVLQKEAAEEAKKAQELTEKAKPHSLRSKKLTEESKEISIKNQKSVKEVSEKDVLRAKQAAESIKRKATLMANEAKDQANQVMKDAAENAAMAGAAVPTVPKTTTNAPVDVDAVNAAKGAAEDAQKTLDSAKEAKDEAKEKRDALRAKAAEATGADKVDLEAAAKRAGVKVTAARRTVEKDAEELAKKEAATAKVATTGVKVGPIKKDASVHIHVHYPK